MLSTSRPCREGRPTSKTPNGLPTSSSTASYAPALSLRPGPRIVRELTRSRVSLSEERSRVIARLQKGLEDANIKLASVASDLMGKSAQQMLHALLEGELTPEAMAEFARGRMRPKREQLVQALTGHLQAHHR